MSIILFIIILAVLILVHECGHFFAAKMFGIRVDEFGLGFPPKLWSKRIGETLYTLNILPLGGFVKIFGENSHTEAMSESDKSRSFSYKPKWNQAIVLIAGIAMNIFFGYILISICLIIGLSAPVGSFPTNQIHDPKLVITSVLPNSPADRAGLISGDIITGASVGKNTVNTLTPETVTELIAKSQSPVTLSYTQGNSQSHTITITPSHSIVADRQAIGISMDMMEIVKLPIIQAFVTGAQITGQFLVVIVTGLWDFFSNIVHIKADLSQVSGPVGIARIVGQAHSIGFVYLLSLVALISFNLAVINLLPFPALDGGRLLFVLIEAISGKTIHPKFVMWTNIIGFGLLISLMVVVSIHDLATLFS